MVNQEEALNWAQKPTEGRARTLWNFLLFFWHQKIPELLDFSFSATTLLGCSLRILSIALIATSPFWIDYYTVKSINQDTLFLFVVALIICMLYIWIYDMLSKHRRLNRKHRESDRDLALRQTQAVAQIAKFLKTSDDTHDAELDNVIRDLLNCIDRNTQAFIKENNEQYFQITLLGFLKDNESAIIGWRAHSNRPVGKTVSIYETAAYYVAKAGLGSKSIHDLKGHPTFPFSGLSDNGVSPPYRSILFIPVSYDGTCKGVVCLDAAEPFEFWGAREDDLTVKVMPYVRLIDLFLSDTKYGITIH